MAPDLPERLALLLPTAPDALRALLEREVLPALEQYRRDQAEWVRVPRLEESE